jgi:hypothetical protein
MYHQGWCQSKGLWTADLDYFLSQTFTLTVLLVNQASWGDVTKAPLVYVLIVASAAFDWQSTWTNRPQRLFVSWKPSCLMRKFFFHAHNYILYTKYLSDCLHLVRLPIKIINQYPSNFWTIAKGPALTSPQKQSYHHCNRPHTTPNTHTHTHIK